MHVRVLAAFSVSFILGLIIKATVIYVCISKNIMQVEGGGGSFLPRPELDRIVIVIASGIFGGLFALICTFAAYAILKNLSSLGSGVRAAVPMAIVFALLHAGFFAFLEYNNAIYGKRTGGLEDFQQKVILTTAVIELITGFLIGLVSTLIVSFLLGPPKTPLGT